MQGWTVDQSITDAMPDPDAWPCCRTCGEDYVLRRVLMLVGTKWVWQPDCKGHKEGPMLRRKSDDI